MKHKWGKPSPENPFHVNAYVIYCQNYLAPHNLQVRRHPPVKFCMRCKIQVPKSGPRAADMDCAVVLVREVMDQ